MKTFDGMAFDAICSFQDRHASPVIGRVERCRIEGHQIVTTELAAEADERRRFRVAMSDGRHSKFTGLYALTGRHFKGLGEVG